MRAKEPQSETGMGLEIETRTQPAQIGVWAQTAQTKIQTQGGKIETRMKKAQN